MVLITVGKDKTLEENRIVYWEYCRFTAGLKRPRCK